MTRYSLTLDLAVTYDTDGNYILSNVETGDVIHEENPDDLGRSGNACRTVRLRIDLPEPEPLVVTAKLPDYEAEQTVSVTLTAS